MGNVNHEVKADVLDINCSQKTVHYLSVEIALQFLHQTNERYLYREQRFNLKDSITSNTAV